MILKRIDPQVPISLLLVAICTYALFHQSRFITEIQIMAAGFFSGYSLCKAIYWKQIEAAKPPKGPSIFPLFK